MYDSFVEDYYFSNSGDLDYNNGRFCVTPDFPNGIYAYFEYVIINQDQVKITVFEHYGGARINIIAAANISNCLRDCIF